MTIADLQKQFEDAQKQEIQSVLENRGEYRSARNLSSSLYLKLSKAYMDEFVKTRNFPVEIIGDEKTLYLFFHRRKIYTTFRLDNGKIAIITLNHCMSVDFRYNSGLSIDGQPLPIFDLFPSPVEIVENSLWAKEIEDAFKDRDNYNQVLWQTQNHYVVRFLSEMGSGLRVTDVAFKTHLFHSWLGKLPIIMDCIAQSFDIEIRKENMNDVLAKIAEQIFAEEERA